MAHERWVRPRARVTFRGRSRCDVRGVSAAPRDGYLPDAAVQRSRPTIPRLAKRMYLTPLLEISAIHLVTCFQLVWYGRDAPSDQAVWVTPEALA